MMIPFNSHIFICISIQREPNPPQFQPKRQKQLTQYFSRQAGSSCGGGCGGGRAGAGMYQISSNTMASVRQQTKSPPSPLSAAAPPARYEETPHHSLQRQRTQHLCSDLLRYRTSSTAGELSLDAVTVVPCRCPQNKSDCMGISDMCGVNIYLRDKALTDLAVKVTRGQHCGAHLSFGNSLRGGDRGDRGGPHIAGSSICSSNSSTLMGVGEKSPWGRKSSAYTPLSSTRTAGGGGVKPSTRIPFIYTRTVGGGGINASTRAPFILTRPAAEGGRRSSSCTPLVSTVVS